MRADRLLTLLLLLQAGGKSRAGDLAAQLGVSVRTVYRDIDALSRAGVPVWAEGGPGGGCQLLEGYRNPLVGVSADEAIALLAASASAALANSAFGQDLAAARLKLLAALPMSSRGDVVAEAAKFHVDAPAWFRAPQPVPHLGLLIQAVRADRRVQLTYAPGGGPRTTNIAEPLGMVSKAGVWYLVGQVNGRRLVYRADRILEAELRNEQFRRSSDFDLVRFWDEWSRDFEASRPKITVTVRIHPALWVILPELFGVAVRSRMEAAALPDEKGWRHIELTFESPAAARTRILGLGPQALVLEPTDIRDAVVAAATQLVELYGR